MALATLLVAGCGGSAASGPSTTSHRTTPVSARALILKALPLGDGYVSTSPKVGYVDSCMTHFGIGGSQVNGPWINTTTKTWNYEAKIAVSGAIKWPKVSYSVKVVRAKRVIAFNDLPINHTTGVFPIAASDPAYGYDHNGNHIASQKVSWSLPLHPRTATKPSCTGGGPIGVLSDGVMLYNALDGAGRDAAAHEVLDACAGHPDPSNSYHHHDVPPCILKPARKGQATLVGYALDGYGIYVVRNKQGAMPTNRSLDACHGTTSRVTWNGATTRIYHYVATYEYPYTVGCYRGTPIASGHGGGPPGGGPAGGGPPLGGPPPGAGPP
jgi:hypothetical protein